MLTLKSLFSPSSKTSASLVEQRNLLLLNYQLYSTAINRRFVKAKNAASAEQAFKTLDLDVRTHFFTLDTVSSAKQDDVKEKVLKIVKWKLSREQFRPTLYAQASSNSPSLITESLLKAINDLEDDLKDFDFSATADGGDEIEEKVEKLTEIQYKAVEALSSKLSGIGPATATAILSQVHIESNAKYSNLVNLQGICPFMSDAALSIVSTSSSGKIEYTKKSCKNLFNAVNRKWLELYGANNKSDQTSSSAGKRRDRATASDAVTDQESDQGRFYKMSPAQISHCLWVETMMKK